MSDVKGFVDANLPAAQAVAQKIGVDPMVILGQWGLETGWGKSVVPGTNNLGNIKGRGVAATDNQTGATDQYRAYSSPAQFSADFSNVIANRFPGAVGSGPDAIAYANALKPGQQGGYAEDPQYVSKLAGAAAAARAASGVDIDPSKVQWDSPGKGATPSMVPGPSLDPQIDTSKVKWDAAPAAQPSAPKSGGSLPAVWPGGELGRQIGLTARAAGHGIADAVDLVGAPLNATINTLFGAHLHNPGDAIRNATDAVTPAPQNNLERIVNAGAAGMAGAVPSIKASQLVAGAASPLLQAIGSQMAAQPGSQIVAGATGGMSAQAAAQAGANPLVQMLAGIAGGTAGYGAARGVASAANRLATAAGTPIGEMPVADRVEPSMPQSGPPAAGGEGAAATANNGRPGSTFYTDSQGNTFTTPPAGVGANAQGSTLRGVGAAETNLNPYAGQLTGEEAARGGSSAFPQVKMAKGSGDVAPAEQAVRAQIANEVLGPDNNAVRTGVITGNEDTLRSEYTNAKSPENTPAQLVLRDQIAREQQALSNYAQDRVAATGANPNLINNEQRGLAINDALYGPDSLNDYFQRAKNQIYDDARAQTGANPIQSTHVDELLKDPQFLAEAERNGHSGVVSGVQRLIDLARTTGFKDPITGELTAPGSVAAWDAVRKSNNAGWTPDNARTIAAVNRAIDQDVAAAAGSASYKLGDAVHQAQKTLLDAPGIAKVFGDADANGIKGGVAFEKLPQKLNNLPLDQWRHIYNTLDDLSRGQIRGAPEGMPPVPPETQQLAAAARDEMKGALAREVYEQGAGKTGVWNQNSVNKTLNSVVGQKIAESFSPDEVARFHALNYAGQIMPGVHSYEGAGLQTSRLDKPGFVEKYAPGTAYIAGAKVGGPIGGWVSEKTANLLTSSLKEKRLAARGNQLIDAMRANSSLGKN
ncbi:glucosaminidase domain-containing protein [Burkholderia cepacia]|uniref:glucosaminidase domain-containing protein n=1 Tax=Burkholderia cepacia TaxID=292 RepID=UPI002AAFEF48|nr:glucosaminidase domain-containing protein [Burkholderia cepacia]